jgi:hypothetical protein
LPKVFPLSHLDRWAMREAYNPPNKTSILRSLQKKFFLVMGQSEWIIAKNKNLGSTHI